MQPYLFLLDIYLDNFSDSCDINIDGENGQHYETNPNNLTKPEIIFYWEIILLVLHLGLGGTSILLQRLEKEVTSENIFLGEIFFIKQLWHDKVSVLEPVRDTLHSVSQE